MAKLARILQKIFGSSGDVSQFGQIGSQTAGSPLNTKALDTIQALTQYVNGLYSLTANGAQPPYIEDLNSLYLLITSQLKYLFQNGVPEWVGTENYYNLISFVQVAGVVYQSINGTDGTPNLNNDPTTNPTKWRNIDPYQIMTTQTLYLKTNRDIVGLVLSNNTVTPNTKLDILAGYAVDSSAVDMITLGSNFVKTTGSWAVGTGNGGLDTGSIAAAAWYAVFLIKRVDTGVVDVLFSLSDISPTMPTNYTLSRRIGWFKTASSNIVPFTQKGRKFFWNTKILDSNLITPPNTNRQLITMTAPKNTMGIFYYRFSCSVATYLDMGSSFQADVAASVSYAVMEADISSVSMWGYIEIHIDSSNQIYYRVHQTTGTVLLSILTAGWTDYGL